MTAVVTAAVDKEDRLTDIKIAKNGFFFRPLADNIPDPFYTYPNPPEFQGFVNRNLAGTIVNGIDHVTLVLDPLLGNPENAGISGTQDIAFTWKGQSTCVSSMFSDPINSTNAPIRGTADGDIAYRHAAVEKGALFFSSSGGSSSGNLSYHNDLFLQETGSGNYIIQGRIDPLLRLFPLVGVSYYADFSAVVSAFDPSRGFLFSAGYRVILYLKLISRQLNEIGQASGTSKSFYFGAINQVVEYEGSYLKNYVADVFEQSTGSNPDPQVQDNSPPTRIDDSTFTQSIQKSILINELGTAIGYTKLTSQPPNPSNTENEVNFLARDDARFGAPVQSIISDESAITVVDASTAPVRNLDLSQDPNTQYDIKDLNNYASFNPKEFVLGKNSEEFIDDVILRTWDADKALDPEFKTKTIRFASIPGAENFTELHNSDVKYLSNSVSFLAFDVGAKQSVAPPTTEVLPGGGGGTEN
jgi:hypothetical protein